MVVAKQVADLITLARAFLAALYVWLGIREGANGLTVATWLLLVNWTGDSLDGPLARRSRVSYQTWIGDHDLQIDMLVSVGLLGYMVLAGFLIPLVAAVYLVAWFLVFWLLHSSRGLGMLFQAPIYGWFILMVVRNEPSASLWIIGWIVLALVVTWPKFPKEIVPGFLGEMQRLRPRNHRSPE